MKTYHVELSYELYKNFTVQANTPEEAEALAWKELESDSEGYGTWEIDSVSEVK